MIINKDALFPDAYIEDKKELIHERKEVEELKRRFLNYFNGKEPAFLRLISGPSGSGKTLSIRYALVSIFNENPDFAQNFIYINGTDMRTPRSMFQYLLNQLGGSCSPKEAITSILTSIRKKLDEKKRRYLFVIDEVDKIYYNSRESPKYLFLHSLNRMDSRPRHATLLITNDFNLTKNFSTELTSNMTEDVFEAYSAEDIMKILRLRAKHCLEEGSYKESDLARIAKETYQNPSGGDQANIRHALCILLNAAVLAQERGTQLSETIDESILHAKISDLTQLLRKYNKHQLFLIKAVAQLKKDNTTGLSQYQVYGSDMDIETIKKAFYDTLAEEGAQAISERQMYNYIQQFTDEHLFTRINKARYCFTENADDILLAISKMN